MRVVRGAVRHRPFLHAVGDRIDDRRIERLEPRRGPAQLGEDGLGEILPLGVLAEDVLAVDGRAGLLEVVLRRGDAMVRDRAGG